jgi:hypothetical protein
MLLINTILVGVLANSTRHKSTVLSTIANMNGHMSQVPAPRMLLTSKRVYTSTLTGLKAHN